LPQHGALRDARSRRRAHAARQAQRSNSGQHPLSCSAAGEQNGAGPQLSEEEVKRMTDDFVKEIIEGAGADDPESKTYQIWVRATLVLLPNNFLSIASASVCPLCPSM